MLRINNTGNIGHETKRKEGRLVLCALNPFVKEIFVVSGFESLIPLEDTVEAGLKRLDAK